MTILSFAWHRFMKWILHDGGKKNGKKISDSARSEPFAKNLLDRSPMDGSLPRMKIVDNRIILAATDISNHLNCHRLTSLELLAARKTITAPTIQTSVTV